MCGIAGIISTKPFDPGHLVRMSEQMKHRGPDDEGYCLFPPAGEPVFLRGDRTIPELGALPHHSSFQQRNDILSGIAHRRLSILDLTETGHQPMTDPDTGCVIVLNGEIYNYLEIKQELETKGHTFRSRSDTEVILHAYREWGAGCVNRFLGMWAFCLADPRENRILLSRDRFGIKPLYYYPEDDALYFASEAKSIVAVARTIRLDEDNVFRYMANGSLSNPDETLIRGLREVPEGSTLFINTRTLGRQVGNYYTFREHIVPEPDTGEDSHIIRFRELLDDSVKIHLRSDVPVGSCLSGGLDSSAIVAFAASRPEVSHFATFTARYDQPAIDESRFAGMVVARYPRIEDHYTTPSAEGFWKDWEKLIWHQDFPFHSTSMYAQWEVMKLAGGHRIKVLLDGQGSDEILGGYDTFVGQYLYDFLKKGKLGRLYRESSKLRINRKVYVYDA
ncbi:MAG TPA: asparagine synthase (glutamine-hydrolyzing), partial [Bacteroidales bacterium]|nr:asparagine synthase (glutamine-hydrolyzing) [Bacteroidales bacterium]